MPFADGKIYILNKNYEPRRSKNPFDRFRVAFGGGFRVVFGAGFRVGFGAGVSARVSAGVSVGFGVEFRVGFSMGFDEEFGVGFGMVFGVGFGEKCPIDLRGINILWNWPLLPPNVQLVRADKLVAFWS